MANQNDKSEANLEMSDVEDGVNDSANVPKANVLGPSSTGNSSDDEEEVVPKIVDNYYFTDDKEEPISFTVLPFDFDEDNVKDGSKEVFLWATADSGLQKVYKQAVAWKLNLQEQKPVICVKTKENIWIQLQKPRKSFEETIRSVLVVVHFLHFARRNPEASEKAHWDHLRKVFSMCDVKPTENDLLEHLSLMGGIYQRDQTLKKSDVLKNLLDSKSKKRKLSNEEAETNAKPKKTRFLISDDELDDELADDGMAESDEEEDDLFDSVCSICDNGGELLCCEGPCLRSFHARREEGADSNCKSLGLSKAQVKEILNFYCLNCKYKQHQCFVCGKLGSSDKSSGAEVFCCVSATCGRFYHPECVSKLLVPEDEVEDLVKRIASGQQFTCPVHKCVICKGGEKKDDEDLQFAICRRCPKAYHRKCLPSYISFDDTDDEPQRAWDDLIPNRILIYCKKHKIDEDLGTPKRNHIIFPEVPSADKISVKRNSAISPDSKTGKVSVKKNKVISPEPSKEKVVSNHSVTKEKSPRDAVAVKVPKSSKESERPLSVRKEDKYPSLEVKKSSVQKEGKPKVLEQKDGKGKLFEQKEGKIKVLEQKFGKLKPLELNKSKTVKELPSFKSSIKTKGVVVPSFTDSDIKNSVMDIIRRSTDGLTLQDVCAKLQVPSTHQRDTRNLDKTVTLGRVEGSVEAVRSALKKLEEGGSIDDARAVCEPDLLVHISKWKNKLKVYLAPFLHGMRYTSFGRHFTKVDKLQEVVERLHWYVQNEDTIVDFCCGANDFSRLMKEKLEQSGKNCFFKNFDIIQPKNDFAFEKRDWLTVRKDELPTGTRLIMGLNPPFGVKAALANKFIEKALVFKPKLLILIVPVETKRLDEKAEGYDLIWEDADLLKGQSFYFPGSVGSDDQQLGQWNTVAPPLYLWSRPDWTVKHKAIAIQQGHISKVTNESHMTESQTEAPDTHVTQDGLVEGNGLQAVEGKTNAENHIAKEDKQVSGFFTETTDQPHVTNRENENVRSKHTLEESRNQKDSNKQNRISKVGPLSATQKMDDLQKRNVTSNKVREEQKESHFRSESQRKDKESDMNNRSRGHSGRHVEQTHGRRHDRGVHDDERGSQQHLRENSPSRERTEYEREIYDRLEKDGDIFENDRLEKDRRDKDISKRERPGREGPEKGRLEKERTATSPPLKRMESRKDLDTEPYNDFSQQHGLLNASTAEIFGRSFERGLGNREEHARGFQIGSNNLGQEFGRGYQDVQGSAADRGELSRGFQIGSSNLGQEFGRGYQDMQGGGADEDYRRGYHRLSGNAEDGFGRGIQRGFPGNIDEEYGRGIQLGLTGNVDGEYLRGMARGHPGSLEEERGRGFLKDNATEEFGRGFQRNFGGNREPEYPAPTDLQLLQGSGRPYNIQGQHDFDSERSRLLRDSKYPEWLPPERPQRESYYSDQGSHVNSAYFRNSDREAEMRPSFMLGNQHEPASQLHSRVQYHSEPYDTGFGSSAMQRYAPRLDQQLHHSRSNLHHIEQASRTSILGAGSVNFPIDPRGFAPGPQNPFPHQSSSGWIDE